MAGILQLSTYDLYLTYNIYDDSFSGGTEIRVRAQYYTDEFPQVHEDDYIVEADPMFTFFYDSNGSGLFSRFFYVSNISPSTISEGVYQYYANVIGVNSQESKVLNINLKVINEDLTPVENFVYKDKYFIDRNEYSLKIQKLVSPNEIILPVEINGKITHSYQSKNDLFDTIIASNLRLSLESSINLTLEDLYSEEEKTYRVILYRNNKEIFIGFLKPDGIYEDYVSDKWQLEIECFDGLSTLKNISFLNDNGIAFSGRKSAINIIYNCLKKTGLDLPINVNCQIYYPDGFNDYENGVLNAIYLNTERYYQTSNEPMDCENVLQSILKVFNCTIIQMNGEWWIYRSIDLIEDTHFAKYIDGVFALQQISYYPRISLGSQINDFDIIHCNSNQKKSISPSVQAYRIFYEYGAANNVFSNGSLRLEGAGLNIPGWTVYNPDGDVYRNDSGYGLSSITKYFNNNAPALLELNQTVNITEGFVFKLVINFSNESKLRYGQTTLSSNGLTFSLGIGNNWLKSDGSWSTSQERIFIKNSDDIKDNVNPPPGNPILIDATFGKGDATYDFTVRAPYSGMLKLIIWRDKQETGGGTFKINSIDLAGTNDSDIKGKDYTAQRTRKVSTVTKSNITVNNGDSASDVIIGTIFKSDADTPTTTWWRGDPFGQPTESKEILAINAEDNLRIAPRPMIIFEGDVYGYMPYLSLIRINNFEGKQFQVTDYSYNISSNVLRLTSREFSSDYLDESEFSVYATNNYGNETKVTITS